MNIAKVYAVAIFKRDFVSYCDGKPSKFAIAVRKQIAIAEERNRVANLPPAPGLIARLIG